MISDQASFPSKFEERFSRKSQYTTTCSNTTGRFTTKKMSERICLLNLDEQGEAEDSLESNKIKLLAEGRCNILLFDL